MYWKQFPLPDEIIQTRDIITGEVAPEYLANHQSGFLPKKFKTILPNLRFIVLLRDPGERAVSLYNQRRQDYGKKKKPKGRKYPSLERIIAESEDELKSCYARSHPEKRKLCHTGSNLLASSFYLDHLNEWLSHFPRNQFLFLNTDELLRSPKAAVQKVFRFLEISENEVLPVSLHLPLPDEQVKDPAKLAELTGRGKEAPSRALPALKDFLCEFYKASLPQVVKLTGLQLGANCGFFW